MDFVDKADFAKPIHIIIQCTVNTLCLTLKYVLNSVCAQLATGTLVLIRLHKKVDSLEMKVNSIKYRKVLPFKNNL